MNTKELIKEVKSKDEDFEFYPTTEEIIRVISKDINFEFSQNKSISILDIGAGNGNFFQILESLQPIPKNEWDKVSFTKYAIEKSSILINNMSADIFVVGTDFHQQTLIDKKVNIIFCNPPYSEYLNWAEKIISEVNCQYVYLVIPERWKKQKSLLSIIKKRDINYKVLGSFDFLDADRTARAKVDIVKIKFKTISYNNNDILSDPFDIWFDNFFKIKAEESEKSSFEKDQECKKSLKDNLIKGQNLIERLEELYQKDFENLLNNYRAIEKLDFEIFRELGVDIQGLKKGLKLKIEGLKNLYWKELFDNLESITSRLTKDSRKKLLDKLMSQTSVDYTAQNAYAIVIWAIKNSNLYIDEQLKSVYLWMSDKENVRNYKSNTKFIEDGWRFNKSEQSHYTLDYRLVFKCYGNFNPSSYGSYDYTTGLKNTTHEKINDIITIAKNLGFNVYEDSYSFQWSSGISVDFTCPQGLFMNIRAYKNGNIHCKINQEFMKKLNIEAGRLNGWIKSQKEASDEMGIPIQEVNTYYKTNLQILERNIKLIA